MWVDLMDKLSQRDVLKLKFCNLTMCHATYQPSTYIDKTPYKIAGVETRSLRTAQAAHTDDSLEVVQIVT